MDCRSESGTPRKSAGSLRNWRGGWRGRNADTQSLNEANLIMTGRRTSSMSTLTGGPTLETLEAEMACIAASLGVARKKPTRKTLALTPRPIYIQEVPEPPNDRMSGVERKKKEERLRCIDRETDNHRTIVKKLRLLLDKIDGVRSLDSRIQHAELECRLEKEELHILDLQAESQTIRSTLDSDDLGDLSPSRRSQESLFRLVPNNETAALVSLSVDYDQRDPPFKVEGVPGGLGVQIESANPSLPLRPGDRLLEAGGEGTTWKSVKEVRSLLAENGKSLDLVVLRAGDEERVRALDQALRRKEQEILQLQNTVDRVRKERESLKSENLRCTHRISYLEEHIVELETAIRQRPSHPGHHYQNLQVFQRGGTVTKIPVSGTAGKKNSPSPGKAGQRSGSAERFETMSDCAGRVRRVSRCPSGPRGGTSDVDAAYLSDTARPLPPKKPERLSLYRATSVQSVEQGGSGSGSTRKRNHKGENRVMKTWPSVERSLGNGLATFKSKSEFKWPSLQGLRLRGGSGSSSSSSVALLHHNNKKTKEQWC